MSLVWSNAMQYNAKNTIYYKQAKAIQELAAKLIPAARHHMLAKRRNEDAKSGRGQVDMKQDRGVVGEESAKRGSRYSARGKTMRGGGRRQGRPKKMDFLDDVSLSKGEELRRSVLVVAARKIGRGVVYVLTAFPRLPAVVFHLCLILSFPSSCIHNLRV